MTAAQARAQKLPKAQPDANGVWDLDVYQAEATHEPFRFRLGGASFDLPHMGDIDWHVALGGGGGLESLPSGHELLRHALGERWDEFAELKLSAEGYNELQRRWHKHSGIDLGESAASPGSSESTAGQ